MSHKHSRKSFLGKFLGMMTAAGIVPAFVTAKRPHPRPAPAATTASAFKLRAEPRAVSRTDV